MPATERRRVVYCLVPEAAADELLAPLRSFYEADDRVEVIVDRRIGPRRSGRDRRENLLLAPGENRREGDRRARGDRRSRLLPRHITAPPEELGGPLRWAERLVPLGGGLEEEESAALVARLREGDASAPTELYWRVHERVRARLEQLVGDAAVAEAAIPETVGRLIDALEHEDPDGDFWGWVERQVDAAAAELPARAVETPADPADDPQRRLALAAQAASLRIHGAELQEPLTLRHHDPGWEKQARTERTRLRALLDGGAVEHVGATAVPGLDARPVIDLLGAVPHLPPPPPILAALTAAGYELLGEAGVPGRILARRRGDLAVDLHLVERGSALWSGVIALRDLLKADAGARERCLASKLEALRGSSGDPELYAELRAPALDELTAAGLLRFAR